MTLFRFALGFVLFSGVFGQTALAFSANKPSGAEAPSSLASTQLWITRADGAQSCSTQSGQSLEMAAADLRKAKVRVLESRKGSDGKMHAQMCGAPSGSTNAFLIPKDDLPQAVALGYIQAH